MGCRSWKSSLPFALTFLIGILAVNAFVSKKQESIKHRKFIYSNGQSVGYVTEGSGCGECDGIFNDEGKPAKNSQSETTPLKVLSKPKAIYTDEARQNQTQGIVTLRVTFVANGTIGSISPVSGLPNGLTEQSIGAAREIKFVPQIKNGQPQTVTRIVQYSFTLY